MASFRYVMLRGELFASSLRAHLSAGAGVSLVAAVSLAAEAAQRDRPFSRELFYRSAAMSPTLSAAGEALFVRRLAGPAPDVQREDLVLVERGGVPMVRRVTAVAGDELESDVSGAESYTVLEGQCWLEADNSSLPVAEAHDSRSFGPVSLDVVTGRVLYSWRSPNDHGRVETRGELRDSDAAVLAHDLSLPELARAWSGEPPATPAPPAPPHEAVKIDGDQPQKE